MIEQGNIFTRKLSYYLEYNYKDDYCHVITFKTDDDKFLENVIEYINTCISAHEFLAEKKERIGYSTEYQTIVFSSVNKEVATDIIRYIKNYIYSYQQKENEEREYEAFLQRF